MHLTRMSVRLVALLAVIAGFVLALSSLNQAPGNVGADAGAVLVDSITCSDQYLFTTFKGGPPPDVGPGPLRTGKTMTRTVIDTTTNTVKWSATVTYLNPDISADDPEAGKPITATTCDEELNDNRINPSSKYSIINLNSRGTGDPAVLVKKFIEDGIILVDDVNNPALHACNDGVDNGPDADGLDAGDANDCNAGATVPALEDFGCSTSAGTWTALSTNNILTPVAPGHTRGVGVLYLDIDSPKDADPANCTEADAFNSAAFVFGFTSEIYTRTITKGPSTAPDDDWDGDGCSDWDELGAPNAPSQSSVVLGRDPFNPEDCDKNFSGVFNIAATISEAVKKYDPTLSEDGAGPDTCGDTMDNGDGDGADAQDADCYTVNPGDYVQCIMALNHDKATKVVEGVNVENISGAIVCYGNTPALGGLAGSAVPSFSDGLSPSSGPPPPYSSAAPQTFDTGLFLPDTNELQFPICFRLGGAVLGPNIIALFNLDGKSLKGGGELFTAQTSTACDAGVPKGDPLPGFSFELLMAEQDDKFDHDSDGCSDLEEMLGGTKYQTITGNDPVGKCGDDPYNPYDSDTDFSGPSSTLATVAGADICQAGLPIDPCAGVDMTPGNADDLADGTLVPGAYYHCIANNISTGVNSYDTPIYCYIDIPGVLVNPEASPLSGDGLSGSPPPLPYGDVDSSHSVLSTTYDKANNLLLSVGCFEDLDGAGALGDVWVDSAVDAHTGIGTVSIYILQAANCAGSPTGVPQVAEVQVVEQPPDWDSDLDGCTDAQELGPNQSAGGLRDPYNQWDLMDTWATGSQTRNVDGFDIGDVVVRFGQVGDPTGDPHEEPTANDNYHTAADRASPILGANPWNLPGPSGNIDGFDIGAVVVQFGHTCVQ